MLRWLSSPKWRWWCWKNFVCYKHGIPKTSNGYDLECRPCIVEGQVSAQDKFQSELTAFNAWKSH